VASGTNWFQASQKVFYSFVVDKKRQKDDKPKKVG
jgi:hypothetical protein